MAVLKIVTLPHPVLKEKTKPVTAFNDAKLNQLISDMAETMYDAPGVGLAANQVGISLSLAVIDVEWKEPLEKKHTKTAPKSYKIFINPEVLEKSGPIEFEEGCLSLPAVTGVTKRYNQVTVKYQDPSGKSHTLKAEGILAVALQHETDHLNGKLYIDHLGPLKRDLVLKRYKKSRR